MTNATGSFTVGAALTVAAVRHRNKEMLSCMTTGRRFTFAQMNERANRLANGLASLGIAKGDVVAFLCNNRAEIVETYFGLAKLGAVGMPLNYRLSAPEIIDLAQLVEARTLIVAPRFLDVAQQVHDSGSGIDRFLAIGDEVPGFTASYDDLLAGASAEEPWVRIEESDPQYFNLTSGTTGSPKAYLLNHYNNAATSMLMTPQFDLTPDDTVLTVFPMFGRVGFGWTLGSVVAGLRNVIMDFEPAAVADVIAQEKCTIVNLVATMAQMLMQLEDFESRDFSSLRGIAFVGAPLPPNVYNATVEKLCPHVYEYYGLQETGTVVDIKPEQKKQRPRSVGQVCLFAEVRTVAPDGRDVGPGEDGEIIARGPTSTTGYFKNPAKTAETFRDGWIHTGDIGRFDEEGFLFITGRAKDVVVTGGQNVFAVEVEARLMSHPAIQDASVIGLPDDFWGELVTAVIVEDAESPATDEELAAFCRETLAGFKVPKRFIRRSEPIPRTPTGKVTKHSLLEEYAVG